jgi:hypothetical protein
LLGSLVALVGLVGGHCALAEDISTEVKETSAKAHPPKLEPAKAGGVFASFQSDEVGRANIYPTVANFSSRFTQRIEYPEDPPPGLKIGNTTLYPTWLETLTYEDNLFGTSQKKQDDWSLYTQPGFGVTHRFNEKIDIGAYYKFGWHDYLDDKARDFLTHNADFSLNCKNIGVDGLSLNVHDTYAQTANTGVLNENFRAFTRQHQNTAGAIVSYELERITATASYDYTILDEFGRNGNDYDYHHVNGMFSYKVNRKVRPYLKYEFYSYDFLTDRNNYTAHKITGGVVWRPYEKYEFDWYLGNNRALAVATPNSNDGPVAGMQLNYYHSQQCRSYFRANYQYEVGVLTGGSNTTAVEAGTLYRIFPELSVGGKVSWTHEDRMSGEDYKTTQAGMLVRYNYKRQFWFFGEYNWTGQDYNMGRYVNWNQATIGFQWKY